MHGDFIKSTPQKMCRGKKPNGHIWHNSVTQKQCEINDLFVGSTETKYIKLKTKTQNDIVTLGIFLSWLFLKEFD